MLMASVLIAALGAVMDVGMSVAASLEEIHTLNPALNARALMGSGMRIGRDMIGTMTNTLILAYTGTALTTMILLLAVVFGGCAWIYLYSYLVYIGKMK